MSWIIKNVFIESVCIICISCFILDFHFLRNNLQYSKISMIWFFKCLFDSVYSSKQIIDVKIVEHPFCCFWKHLIARQTNMIDRMWLLLAKRLLPIWICCSKEIKRFYFFRKLLNYYLNGNRNWNLPFCWMLYHWKTFHISLRKMQYRSFHNFSNLSEFNK